MTLQRDENRDEIRARLSDPEQALDALGLLEGAKRQRDGYLIRCPAHAERNPSCSVQRVDGALVARCHACPFRGDVFDLVAAVRGLNARTDFRRVLAEAAALCGVVIQHPGDRPRLHAVPPPGPAENLPAVWDRLPPAADDPDVWEWLQGTGIEAADPLCRSVPARDPALGRYASQGFRLAVALRDRTGAVAGIQLRPIATPTGGKRFHTAGAARGGVFGDPRSVESASAVVVCEGLSDFLAASVALAETPGVVAVGIAGAEAVDALAELPGLAGKRAVIATDADPAGDEAAERIADLLGKAGARCWRARPTGGKDLRDMLRGGADLVAFLRGGRPIGPARFAAMPERIAGERSERLAMAPHLLRFGVDFLDAVFGCIIPRDVVLIGGRSGGGKTELAGLIADANVYAGRRVHYFALEAEEREIERRRKYRLIALMAHRSGIPGARDRLSYLDWYTGKLDADAGRWEETVDRVLAEQYQRFHTYYRRKRFGADDFRRLFREISDDTDLVVLDHFHVVDNAATNENRGQKEIAAAIADAVQELGKPVVLVAHIRKNVGRGARRVVPELDDFQGSSDLYKVVTKAVTLAPARDQQGADRLVWPTYMSVEKFRLEGSRTAFCGLVDFDARMNSYLPGFRLGRVSLDGAKWEECGADDVPRWAEDGVRTRGGL